MSTPYIGFTDSQFDDAPPITEGARIWCPHCFGEHEVQSSTGTNRDFQITLWFYRCGEKLYLAGINDRLIMGIKPVVSGSI